MWADRWVRSNRGILIIMPDATGLARLAFESVPARLKLRWLRDRIIRAAAG
jgi:hypothetical protein